MDNSTNEFSPAIVKLFRGRRLLRSNTDRESPPIRSEWQELSLVVWQELSLVVDALSVTRSTLIVQFVGPVRSVGTTVVATGFAQGTAMNGARSRRKDVTEVRDQVLLLDCGPDSNATRRPFRNARELETVPEAYHRDLKLDSLSRVTTSRGVTRARLDLIGRDGAVRYSSESVAEIISTLRTRYPVIVLDCPAISQSIAGLLLAPHSDSTIVVVKAGSTRSADLASARARLEQVGGVLAGVVFNRMRVNSRWRSSRG